MYAIVEVMGHRVRAGLISDATLGGAAMLRVEHPSMADHSGDEPLTEYYAPAAIFAIRPCSQEEATRAAETYWQAPRPALAAVFNNLIEDDDDDDEEPDEEFLGGEHPF